MPTTSALAADAASTSRCVQKYITTIRAMSKSTANAYNFRLKSFNSFILTECSNIYIDDLINKLKNGHENPYEILGRYVLYLQNNNNISPLTLKQWVVTVKNFLEYNDVEISPRKFQLKVKLPKVVRKDKQALSKEDIVEILNACSEIRLKTYVMLLAATGMRAVEALSSTIKDIDFKSNPPRLSVHGENTKTKTDRIIFLTNEVAKQLSAWIDYKHRTRRVCHSKDNGKSITEYRTPERDLDELVFGVYQIHQNPQYMYVNLCTAFEKTLDRIGMSAREGSFHVVKKDDSDNSDGGGCSKHHYSRRRITLHSFRRWVKSTISDLGYGDYSEYYLGHANVSTYYRKNDKEKAELFRKIEPYLTFLDFNQLSARQADISTALEQKEDELITLKASQKQLQDELNQLRTMMQTISDKYLVTLATPTEKKIMDKHRTPTPEEFAVIEKEKEEARIAEANEQVSKSTHYYT
jgi:integrase